ncbi:nitrate regulatory gene2 protein [Brachypodium distachyon]|uniref:DUF632 domain-containing protein n=1 Tax=Brachypodium distachyon TaxID=15368 RepID=A0A0Q3PKU6_BRADI|nr:nitrate regulatory gene2 protein [Brachypodium distachyon]KQJ90017.1 hypothetical protein BRADI_4g29000v3 [Brachypodium distachyon]|eukprot:XP_003578038.1 nitrate regulatory gene2 protein [Brachypodium distachyon]
MGSSVSKHDSKEALQLCKGRLKYIVQAIDARYALSAAHLLYEQSLHNVGIALRQFVESHNDGDLGKSPRSSPSPLQPADGAKFSPVLVPGSFDVSCMRSEISPSLTVRVNPNDASFSKEGQPIPISCPSPLSSDVCSSWDFFDPNDVIQNSASHVPENSVNSRVGSLEDFRHTNERDLASSIGDTSQIAEIQEELGTYGCKQVDDNYDSPNLNNNDCNEIEIAGMHLPNDSSSSLMKGHDQVRTLVEEGQNPICMGNNGKNDAYYNKANVPNGSSERGENKGNFLSDVKELEHLFTRAAESCHEVSKMLETRKIRLGVSSQLTGKSSGALSLSSSLVCCKAGNAASHELEQHATKVIARNRSLSSRSSSSKNPLLLSAQQDDDSPESCSDFVEEFGMISGSHASSLDRLYAWERKLYDELKSSEPVEKIYDKKCGQLLHQFARDANVRQVDKTRATVKELYSRLMVRKEVLYIISKLIEKLRDEELQPQLLELLQGLMRMWSMMQEVHQMQQIIISLADTKSSSVSPPSESHKHTLMNLITELEFFYTSLINWVDAYKSYVGGLHSWLQKCVVEPRHPSRGRRLTLSPREHLAPPLFVLFEDWSTGISSLPSEEPWDSIKNLIADLKKMYKHQAEHKLAKKKPSDSGVDANTGKSVADGGKSETESKLATLQDGLTTMFSGLSELSGAMASLSENVKRETEIAQEAYTIGRR